MPDKEAVGATANLQATIFLQNYQSFLAKSPGWLNNLETASEDVLCFLKGMMTFDGEAQEKHDKYIQWVKQEELYYKQSYSKSKETISYVYINNNVQNEGTLLAGQTPPPPRQSLLKQRATKLDRISFQILCPNHALLWSLLHGQRISHSGSRRAGVELMGDLCC